MVARAAAAGEQAYVIPPMAIALSTFALAQLVDLLPSWAWNALYAGGMFAPVVGLLISLAMRSVTSWKRKAVMTFYILSLPLVGLGLLAQTENPVAGCSMTLSIPIGMILGLAVLVPRASVRERHGFEVQPKRDGEAGQTTHWQRTGRPQRSL
jgi:hypothetical protein